MYFRYDKIIDGGFYLKTHTHRCVCMRRQFRILAGNKSGYGRVEYAPATPFAGHAHTHAGGMILIVRLHVRSLQ
jgi:hypothetical protein